MASSGLYRVDTLTELRAALLSFRGTTATIPDLVARRLDLTERRLNNARAAAETRRTACLKQLCHSDDDRDAEEDMMVAEEALNEIDDLIARFDRARTQSQAFLSRWLSSTDRAVSHAGLFLQRAVDDATDYLAVSLPRPAAGGTGRAPTTIERHVSETHPIDGPTSVYWRSPSEASSASELPPLPNGFEWLPIDRITDREMPGSNDPPKGVPELQVRLGVERLWKEVLPLVGGTPDEMRERCRKFDNENNRIDRRGFVHKESVLAVWDAFFNTGASNQIRADMVGASGRISITNGRHRIKVAKELGWRFIPAQVIHHD